MWVVSEELIADFVHVAILAGFELDMADIEYEVLEAPHRRPSTLRPGKQAVYVFCTASHCLKVGKVGSRSAARFTYQHYNPGSARSSLALSLINQWTVLQDDVRLAWENEVTASNVGAWIEQNTTRYHFFIDEAQPRLLLSLLEVFLQCRLRPLFEGS